MPAAPYLADPAVLAALLEVPADDPRMLTALRLASARFRGAVRHPVSLVENDTVFVDGTGRATLPLPAAPVVRLGPVIVDGTVLTGVRVRRSSGVLLHPDGCWPEWAEITVTYDHGHDPVPDDIAEAVIDKARALHDVVPAVQQITTGSESVSFAAVATVGTTDQWRTAVEAHRLNRGDGA
ncbi:mobile element protein [Streptomyces uncialis]|uniref:mobile element protein n=1 Tax=Streptomyces uncialis TaxID=1048205 RepID=UPI00224F8B1E|nr:mobile element protein [Streptomyces uncialis]MCX4661497.1 mobile element protein [Streptomyces uncialis]